MNTNDTPTVLHSMAKIWASLIGLILLLAAPVYAQSYTVAPQGFGTVLDDSGRIVVGGCVWTYAAGTTTPIATYSNSTGTLNANPIVADYAGRYTAFLIAGTNYKFVYENVPCSSGAHGTVLRTADNIAGTPSAAATVDMTCTAGETISAAQAVYLSAGSGGKAAGQCYKADSANAYSSSGATVFGIAPSAIVSGLPGTVRIAGPVSGLSSLSIGSDYYIGSSGAVTSTAPTNARKLGAADSTTSMILTLPPAPTQAWVDDFRLTLTTATPVTTADVTAATTLFLSPYTGNRLDLPDATGNPQRTTTAEISIAVPATTSQMYDVFVFLNGATPTLELLAWTNDTTRATAIARTNGRWFKSGDLTRMYLGSFRTTAVSGQTEDSLVKRYVWNYYNRVRRQLTRFETTSTWTYSIATIRQANGSALNQVDMVIGVSETPVTMTLTMGLSQTTAGAACFAGLGLDSTTTFVATAIVDTRGAGSLLSNVFGGNLFYQAFPGVGRHFYSWNEQNQTAAGTTTWEGTGMGLNTGLAGWIEG